MTNVFRSFGLLSAFPAFIALVSACERGTPEHPQETSPPARRAGPVEIAEHGAPVPGQRMMVRGRGLMGDGWTALVRMSWGNGKQRQVEFVPSARVSDDAISVLVPLNAHGQGTLSALGTQGQSPTETIRYTQLPRPVIHQVDVGPLRTRVLAEGVRRGQDVELLWGGNTLWRGSAVADGVVDGPSTWHQPGEFDVVIQVAGAASPSYRVVVGRG